MDNVGGPTPAMVAWRNTRAVAPDQLTPRVDVATLPFASTTDVPALDALVGQQDALDALAFGLEVRGPGFNLYVAGENASGRTTAVHALVDRLAGQCPVPCDRVYVHNFDAPDQPRALALPAGRAAGLARAMEAFVRDTALAIRQTLEGDDHDRRRRAALDAFATTRRKVFDELGVTAKEHGFRVDIAPGRVTSIPLVDGEPITDERFAAMSAEASAELARRTELFEVFLGAAVRRLRQIEREEDERRRAFDREAARAVIEPLLTELRGRFADVPDLLAHLTRVADDVAERAAALATPEPVASDDDGDDGAVATDGDDAAADGAEARARYRVNVLIDHGATHGAPVIVERHPTAENLTGRVDYRMTANGLVADFLQIRPGSLHHANGGFLVLRADDLLQTESAWAVLKRALLGPEVRIEASDAGALPATTLRPAAIPLDLKVILIGTEEIYQLLLELDPDFRDLFKVKVEFAPDVPWSEEATRLCAAFLSRCVRDRGLRPLDAGAIARTIEHAARLAGGEFGGQLCHAARQFERGRIDQRIEQVRPARQRVGQRGREAEHFAEQFEQRRTRFEQQEQVERRGQAGEQFVPAVERADRIGRLRQGSEQRRPDRLERRAGRLAAQRADAAGSPAIDPFR